MMDETTAYRIGAWIQLHRPEIVDITGGAAELSEFFHYFVETGRACGAKVIDRNNLTTIEEEEFRSLPAYLAQHEMEVIASLPCYSEKNVNQQRGNGVFEKSIAALRRLNAVGYGSRLLLHLVFNPLGAALPAPQAELEANYREALQRDFGIVFHKLFAITNQPIARFADDLQRHGQWDDYLELFVNSFNPGTVEGLMGRTTLRVGYQGEIYDCDFNQMLGMQLRNEASLYLWDLTPDQLPNRGIATGLHFLACTAGAGSSCGVAVTN